MRLKIYFDKTNVPHSGKHIDEIFIIDKDCNINFLLTSKDKHKLFKFLKKTGEKPNKKRTLFLDDGYFSSLAFLCDNSSNDDTLTINYEYDEYDVNVSSKGSIETTRKDFMSEMVFCMLRKE